jgi:hypothetical protein
VQDFAEVIAFEFGKEEIHGAFDDERQLAAGIRVAREVEAAFEFPAKFGASGEFDAVAVGRERADARRFVAAGKAGRDEHFDLAFGFSADGIEQLRMVFPG